YDILLTIKDDILRENLLNINLLIANIEALNDNPAPSSNFMTKSSSPSLNSLLEETNILDNSLPKFETFCFDLEEISSGSTTTHSNSSLYDLFIFDLLINPFSHAGRSDFFEEDLFTYCIENGILQDSSEPSNDNTNVVNALQEPFVVKKDPVPIISNSEPCHNQNVDELPYTVPSFDPTCYSEDGNSFTYDSTSNLIHESPNNFNPALQPLTYSYKFCGNDAYYGHDCSRQVLFTYDPEPCYNQDFNFA
nr:hypothetical protein [Tanacetum cinerariifolium]